MSKTKLCLGMVSFAMLSILNFTQSDQNFLQNTLASSGKCSSCNSSCTCGCISSSSAHAAPINHGYNADLRCPVWKITYHLGTGNTGRDCETGGEYKCIPTGVCPHGV